MYTVDTCVISKGIVPGVLGMCNKPYQPCVIGWGSPVFIYLRTGKEISYYVYGRRTFVYYAKNVHLVNDWEGRSTYMYM